MSKKKIEEMVSEYFDEMPRVYVAVDEMNSDDKVNNGLTTGLLGGLNLLLAGGLFAATQTQENREFILGYDNEKMQFVQIKKEAFSSEYKIINIFQIPFKELSEIKIDRYNHKIILILSNGEEFKFYIKHDDYFGESQWEMFKKIFEFFEKKGNSFFVGEKYRANHLNRILIDSTRPEAEELMKIFKEVPKFLYTSVSKDFTGEKIISYERIPQYTKCKVNYKDGKPHGKFSLYFLDNILMGEGEFKDGKLNGELKLQNLNGFSFYEGAYKEGMNDGSYKIYNLNGSINIECEYKDGKLNGFFKEYDENGYLENLTTYKNDKAEIEKLIFYKNGDIMLRIPKCEDMNVGIIQAFDRGEKLRSEYFTESGIFKEYRLDGSLIKEENIGTGEEKTEEVISRITDVIFPEILEDKKAAARKELGLI